MLNDICDCRTTVSKEKWEIVEGTFSLVAMPERLVFYLEGPSPSVELLIDSVVISCPNPSKSEVTSIMLCSFSSVVFRYLV